MLITCNLYHIVHKRILYNSVFTYELTWFQTLFFFVLPAITKKRVFKSKIYEIR